MDEILPLSWNMGVKSAASEDNFPNALICSSVAPGRFESALYETPRHKTGFTTIVPVSSISTSSIG
jgi:hypothetical protein